MRKLICEKCMEIFQRAEPEACSSCGDDCYDFSNNNEFLLSKAPEVIARRKTIGLDGLVGGLNSVIINTG